MLCLLTTLPSRSVFVGSVVRSRARFVDEATNTDQTPTEVELIVRGPGGTSATYTWTATQGPTLDAVLVAFSKSTAGGYITFEGQLAIAGSSAPGVWSLGWRARNAQGVELVTEWGSVRVEHDASTPMQPAPQAPPPGPVVDELGAWVWDEPPRIPFGY